MTNARGESTARNSVFFLMLVSLPALAVSGQRGLPFGWPDPVSPTHRGDSPAARNPSSQLGTRPTSRPVATWPRIDHPLSASRGNAIRRLPVPTEANAEEVARIRDFRFELKRRGAVRVRLHRWDGPIPVYQFRCEFPPDVAQPDARGPRRSLSALSSSADSATLDVVRQARRQRVTWQTRRYLPSRP